MDGDCQSQHTISNQPFAGTNSSSSTHLNKVIPIYTHSLFLLCFRKAFIEMSCLNIAEVSRGSKGEIINFRNKMATIWACKSFFWPETGSRSSLGRLYEQRSCSDAIFLSGFTAKSKDGTKKAPKTVLLLGAFSPKFSKLLLYLTSSDVLQL